MSKTMQFIASDGTYIEINRPGYGYSCEIHMPITVVERHPYGYTLWDANNAGTYDYRTCSFKLQLPISQKSQLNTFLRSDALGRCETFTLRLGSDPTGFFPFGPDKGDVGDFTVRVLSQQQGGMLLAPWRYFQDDLTLVMVSAPSYSVSDGVSQGSLSIGGCENLMYPQNGFAPDSYYNYRTDLARAGGPRSVDGLIASDTWVSSWDQICNTGKAAYLALTLIQVLGRAKDIAITAPDYSYVFGMDQGSGGSYLTKFLGSDRTKNEVIIKMTNDRYNKWTIPLSFWFKEKYGDEIVLPDGEIVLPDGEVIFS